MPDSDGSQNKDEHCAPLLGPHYEDVHVVIDPCQQCPCKGSVSILLFLVHFFAVVGTIGSYLMTLHT